jgi:hypothetical protein
MTGRLRLTLALIGTAAAAIFAADTANAGWSHYPATTYFHAPYGAYGMPYGMTAGPRYSLYGSTYGYSEYFNPPYPAYGPAGYGGIGYGVGNMGRPRGRLEYDVYTPYGRQEVEYKFRRNGRVHVDYDD